MSSQDNEYSGQQHLLLKNNKTAEGGISGVKVDVISLAGGEWGGQSPPDKVVKQAQRGFTDVSQ